MTTASVLRGRARRPVVAWPGRPVVAGAGAAVALLAYLFVVLPGQGGGRGTPIAVLFQAVVFGLLNGLTAAGLILVYRTSRVINFAQAAMGAAGGALTFQLLQLTHTPFVLALPAGLALAAATGAVFELTVVRRFARAPRLVVTIVTIAAAAVLGVELPLGIRNLPFFPKTGGGVQELGLVPVRNQLPLPGWHFGIGRFPLHFGTPEVLALEAGALALLLVAAFLRWTRAGVAVRAVAENPERAALLGMSVGGLSLLVWTLAGLLSGTGVILQGALTLPGTASGIAPAILLPALTAAVLARMRSLPAAVGWSIALQLLVSASVFSFPDDAGLVSMALVAVTIVALLAQRKSVLRAEEGAAVSWSATQEQRPIPAELRSLTGLRTARLAGAAVILAAVGLYPFLVGTGLQNLGGFIAIDAIVLVSLIPVTGWAGQVSLGQFALVAVGAVLTAALVTKAGLAFWFAVPVAVVATSAVSVLLGLPALRVKGLFLAVVTFGFAVAIPAVLFQKRYFGWLLVNDVKRPTLVFLDFADERSMYFLAVAGAVLTMVAVRNLRRTRFGRLLIAARENEANLQSFGVSTVRAKLQAFAASGAMCGLAGALLAVHQRGVSQVSFGADRSVEVFLYAVVGGVTSVGGVLLGGVYKDLAGYFLVHNHVFQVIQPVGVLLLLYAAPSGLVSIIGSLRDGVLRIVAQRRQLVVPSLFADYDPEALERRLIPLAEPSDADGLAALGAGREWALRSELYTRTR